MLQRKLPHHNLPLLLPPPLFLLLFLLHQLDQGWL